ncbi:hypothetical protein [Pseudomonas amygdali]|uniref:hypothetical protein n=1 Tax=Pseudomonas amygdali TaxID=47877 RepID=UPI0006B90123|nr:hypothetical protein [Pseudomonas amygdali]
MAILDYVKYENGSASDKRVLAVNAALELISVRIGATSPNGNHLDQELNRLSSYADKIQDALTVK